MFAKDEFDSGCSTTSCYGCGKLIHDRFLLAVLDKNWHVACVRCHHCGDALENKCFFRDGNIYCREDFYRLYGPRCAGCLEGISPTDLVRRAKDKIFHLTCFTCAICRKQLSTGEELYMVDRDRFICKEDFNAIRNQDYGYSDEEDELDEKLCSPSVTPSCITPLPASFPPLGTASTHKLAESNNNKTSLDSSTSIITKIKTEDGDFQDVECGDASDDRLEQENRSPEDSSGKRRGPRTTIKAKQLDVLKNAFQQTPKPTRHIREQLAKETGLSMRVIQVWFQNKRSKERRMKQLTSGMLHRGFFGGPFGDFGYGPRFGHPDFFPGGPLHFLPSHPGLPGLEQPLPMSGCPPLPPDHPFANMPPSGLDKPPGLPDINFMSPGGGGQGKIIFKGKGGLGGGEMGYGGENNLDGYMDMSTQRMPPSTDLSRGDFGCGPQGSGCGPPGDLSDQMDWQNNNPWNKK